MKYISTRGKAPALNFEEVVLAGLAADGGLYVPEQVPALKEAEIAALAGLAYPELMVKVIQPFIGAEIPEATLLTLAKAAYAPFRHSAVAPLKQLGANEFLLELFHGPTLAFKDFALQFLGHLLDHILEKRRQRIVILGATSGDTGSAAIAGCGGRANMDIFILHPHGRVSEVQRRQMTTVADANVHNIAIQGTFDDCQAIVKTLFGDEALRAQHPLVAINSINWARILAQVVYYFHAGLALGAPYRPVAFSVPTGNFGDIYAGYIARQMGLKIEQLIIATNRNDILARCLNSGTYEASTVEPSLSPSMDIQVSSNFERLLFDLYSQDGAAILTMMQQFTQDGKFTLELARLNAMRALFSAHSVSDEETLSTMAKLYEATGELLDPHTAVGIAAGRAVRKQESTPLITLATAHPAKFPEAVQTACKVTPALPAHLQGLLTKPERCAILPNSADAVKEYISRMVPSS